MALSPPEVGFDGAAASLLFKFVSTTPKELNDWLGQQSGKPVHVVTDETDLTSELKRGLSFVRKER